MRSTSFTVRSLIHCLALVSRDSSSAGPWRPHHLSLLCSLRPWCLHGQEMAISSVDVHIRMAIWACKETRVGRAHSTSETYRWTEQIQIISASILSVALHQRQVSQPISLRTFTLIEGMFHLISPTWMNDWPSLVLNCRLLVVRCSPQTCLRPWVVEVWSVHPCLTFVQPNTIYQRTLQHRRSSPHRLVIWTNAWTFLHFHTSNHSWRRSWFSLHHQDFTMKMRWWWRPLLRAIWRLHRCSSM